MSGKTIFISGYAQLPKNCTEKTLYKVAVVGLLIQRETGTILEADCSLEPKTAKEFFIAFMIGQNILDMEEIMESFQRSYVGLTAESVICGLKECLAQYVKLCEESQGYTQEECGQACG